MIYVLAPKPDSPSGGCWFLHRIVKLLNDAGMEARVLQKEPHEIWWDAHPIPASMIGRIGESLKVGSTVIVPEVMWPPPPAFNDMRQIVFVQNRIWLPQGLDFAKSNAEILVVSRYLANHMKRVHKANVIGLVRPYLDDDVWHPTPKKANRVMVVARRNPYHERMKDMLSAAGFDVMYITGQLKQTEIAEVLAGCEFYVHLTHPEGWPMACLEAMRMGTIVVGTTGGGGLEFLFHRETAMVVADPEAGHYSTDDFLNGIMEQMNILRADAGMRSKIWQQASSWSQRYTAENTTKELLEIFSGRNG